jgi:hypothetical protein
MDSLGIPYTGGEPTYLTAQMIRDCVKSLQDAHDRAEERRWEYYKTLRPLLDKLEPDDFMGIYALLRLTQSGFYQPLHPDDAKYCLEIVRSRGIKDFDGNDSDIS